MDRAHAQGEPGLGGGNYGLRRRRRLRQWAAVGSVAPMAQVTNRRRQRAGHGGARAMQGRGGGWEEAHCWE